MLIQKVLKMDINRLREILHVQLIVIAILFVMLIVQDAMIVIVIEINFFLLKK